MSVKIMAEVWEHSQAKDSELLLLLALADHAESVNAQCWPSVARLARLIRKSERNTRYLLRRLEEGGHLAIQIKGSPRKTNLYRILRPWAMGQQFLQENKCAAATGCPSNGGKVVAPDPNSEPTPEEREKTCAQEGNPELILKSIGLTPGSLAWIDALDALQKDGVARNNGFPCRL